MEITLFVIAVVIFASSLLITLFSLDDNKVIVAIVALCLSGAYIFIAILKYILLKGVLF